MIPVVHAMKEGNWLGDDKPRPRHVACLVNIVVDNDDDEDMFYRNCERYLISTSERVPDLLKNCKTFRRKKYHTNYTDAKKFD